MSKSYFEKIPHQKSPDDDEIFTGRVYKMRVENPPTVVIEPGGLVAEFTGSEEEVDAFIAAETEKLEA
jgi:hypothetical protein